MSKALATNSTKELKVYSKSGLMGVAASVSSSDVQIPTLMLMQSNSTLVQESDDINSGDFLHSISHDVWGKKDKQPVELVFFDMFKTQIVSDVSTGKKAWIETKPWNDQMELDPYEQEVEGKMVRREKCFNYVVFSSIDVQQVDTPTGKAYVSSPIIVKFKGGSLKNGKRLNEMFKDYARFGSPSWATTFMLTANLDDKDGSKYWAYDFKKGLQTTKEQQLAAEQLCQEFQRMKQNSEFNVVDEDEKQQPAKKTIVNHATGEETEVNV